MSEINTLRIINRNCVNSEWTASWLEIRKGIDCCQCGFECKIRVEISRMGHVPRTYIVTKSEYRRLRNELTLIK